MIQDLCIVHRRKPNVFATAGGPVWSTCLRSLAFGEMAAAATDEVFHRDQAYQFLLEIICGMHSPIMGETEVFGQFKIFAQEWVAREPQRATLVQKLISDAKQIRSEHLRGLGNQSYGGWIRRKLKADNVHVLGGGHLAQEILPFVTKHAKQVHLHLRDPRKLEYPTAQKHNLQERGFSGGALIVAAPMTAKEIELWLNGQVPTQIFDLRETALSDALTVTSATQKHVLHDIFSQIEQTKTRLVPVSEKVHAAISERTSKLVAQAQIRPQGWDDLCA